MEEKNRKYAEGYFVGMWMGIGITIFSGVGVSLSVVLKIPGLIGIGSAIGVAFGLGSRRRQGLSSLVSIE